MIWTQLPCNSDKSSNFSLGSLERAGHTATAVGNYIYVIGGRRGSRFYHDLLRYNCLTCTWERVFAQLPFAARANHAAILVGSSIWVFGGADAKQVLSDCWVLDINTHNWSQANLTGRTSLLGRCAAGADIHPINQHVILVFGGYGSAGPGSETFDYFNDVLAVDTVKRRVDVIPAIGKAPNPRCFHTFTTLGTRCYVIGGRRMEEGAMRGRNMVAVFDVPSKTWLDAQVIGMTIPPRSSHKAVALEGDRMLVVGGTVELTPVAPAGGDHPQSETQAAPVPQGGTGLLVALCVAPAPARAAAPTTKPGSKEQPAARLTWSEVEDAPAGGGAAGQQQGGGEGPDARPTPRAGHACCINGSRLFMIGGFMTETKNYLPEVWALELAPSTPPSCLTGHPRAGQPAALQGAANHVTSVVVASAVTLNPPRASDSGETGQTGSRKRSRSRSPKGLAQVLGVGQQQAADTAKVNGQGQGKEGGSVPVPQSPQWMTTRRGGRSSSRDAGAGLPPPVLTQAVATTAAPVGAVLSASSAVMHPAAAMHPAPAAASELQGQHGIPPSPMVSGMDFPAGRVATGGSGPAPLLLPPTLPGGCPASPVHASPAHMSPGNVSPGRQSPSRGESSMSEVQAAHQQQVEQLTSYYMQQVNALQAEVARLRGELVRTSSSEANAGVRASSAEAEVGALRSELASLRSSLQHRAVEVQALQQEKKELQGQVNLSISQQQALMNEKQKLQDERQTLVQHGAQAQARARELEGALYAAQTEAEASRVAAQREVEAASRRTRELQEELESSRQSLRNLQDSFARVTDQNNRNMDANSKLTKSLQEAQDKVQEVQRKWGEDAERQRAALDAERAAGAAAVAQLRDERNRAAALEAELTKAKVEMAALQHQVTTATDQATRAQGEARAAEAEASDLRQRLERITQVESDNGTDERLLQEVLSRMRGRRAVLDQEAVGLRARYASGSAGLQLPQLQQHNSIPQQQLQPQVSGAQPQQHQGGQQQVPAVQYPQQYNNGYAPSTSYNHHGLQQQLQNTVHR